MLQYGLLQRFFFSRVIRRSVMLRICLPVLLGALLQALPHDATAASPAKINQSNNSILILGDSLSASYGVPSDRSWVTLLQQRLQQQQYDNLVINASISGETTEGGLQRLPALLAKHNPNIVVLELGANDGLRGFQIERLRNNLEQLVKTARSANARVLLVAMKIPPNYGLRYTSDFYASFTTTAKAFELPMVPFLLDGVATHPELMQEDGLHPNAQAQPRLLDNVWPFLKPLL